jgi:hypothetical protein
MKSVYSLGRKELLALVILALTTIVASYIRFGHMYPDSSYYLLLVEFFRGTLSGTELIAPYCYRPLLPLIAAILPFTPELTFSLINMIMGIFLAWTLFFLAREFGFSNLSSLASSGICSFSLAVAYFGAAVLVDVGAVLFLALSMLLMIREVNGYKIAILLTIGILFKEIAIIGVLAYLFYRKTRDLTAMIIPIITFALIRLVMPSANPEFIWQFQLYNFTLYLTHTLLSLLFGFVPFVLLCIAALIRKIREPSKYSREFKWMFIMGIPASAIFGMGLFMAFFDARFIWPLYIALVPMMAAGSSEILRFLKIEKAEAAIPD